MSEKNNVKTILDMVSGMSAIELMELVKAIEEAFGVSASMQFAVAGGAAAASEDAGAAKEEKVEFKVIIKDAGSNGIGVIKALRSVMPQLGLKEAKDLAVSGSILKENASKDEAEKMKKALAEAGAVVDIL